MKLTARGGVLLLVLIGLVLPILTGLWQTLRAAFGILPALGAVEFSRMPWEKLITMPGFMTSVWLSLWTGFASTGISLVLALSFCAAVHGRMGVAAVNRWLAPFLAVPHAALAIGLAFVIAPSGLLVRAASPLISGWQTPPDLPFPHDPWGAALILGLVIKELPFLLLVILAALGQLPIRIYLAVGQSLGYGRANIWAKVIFPAVWPLIRLPVFVVLSFALSVVDVAIILGPSNPPTLAVAVTRWFSAPDSTMILPASAGALLQALMVAASVAALLMAERLAARFGRWWVRRGGRGGGSQALHLSVALVTALLLVGTLALLSLLLWSLAWRWPYPQIWPQEWSLRNWMHPASTWGGAFFNTALIGVTTTILSLLLAIAWLEAEGRRPRAHWAEVLIYLPLLLPQIAFLYGLNVVFLQTGLAGGYVAVIWAQALFVFPYVMITLSDPWRALDPRLVNAAAALGAGPWRRLFSLKLPILLRPVLTATAVGFAVSVAQYLPTLFLGAGRIATLTTEAVTLASGADRRIVGTYAALQALLPFIAYALALFLPFILYRNRKGLAG